MPGIPHSFYGDVEINGSPAPVGTQVEARGTGVLTGVQGNPITVTQAGKYGGPGGFDSKLVVQGTISDGTPIQFYVNGVQAQCAQPGGPWQDSFPFSSGAVTNLNLRVLMTTNTPTSTPTRTSTPARTSTPTSTPTRTSTPTNTPIPTSTPTKTPTSRPGTQTVYGFVFYDLDGDGHRSTTETTGLANVPLTLEQGGLVVATAKSYAPSGWYQFPNVLPGSYELSADIPLGYVATSPTRVLVQVLSGSDVIVNFGVQAFTPTPTLTPTSTPTPTETPTPTSTPSETLTSTPTPTVVLLHIPLVLSRNSSDLGAGARYGTVRLRALTGWVSAIAKHLLQ